MKVIKTVLFAGCLGALLMLQGCGSTPRRTHVEFHHHQECGSSHSSCSECSHPGRGRKCKTITRVR